MRLLTLVIVSVIFAACATRPVEEFKQVKNNMLKDEVLDILGAPNRTERFDGKEKWMYRYFTGPEKNQEELYFITFYEGKVINYGADTDELERREEIRKDYISRKEKKKAARDAAANLRDKAAKEEAAAAVAKQNALKQDRLQDEAPPVEPNFKEIPGQSSPITQEQ